MLLQAREDALWLIGQHDHALVSGRLAHAWRGLGDTDSPLPFDLVFAIALHDMPWLADDQSVRLNPETGRPFDFMDCSLDHRLALYSRGLDELEPVEPYIAYLVSLHYTAFAGLRSVASFQASERQRRDRLARPAVAGEYAMRADTHLGYLQMFDLMSLFVCLCSPASCQEGLPPWLGADAVGRTPSGEQLVLEWRGDDHLHCRPFPFMEPVHVRLPYRSIPLGPYADQHTLEAAYALAKPGEWRVTITG